ncbi:MAG: phosphoribosylformylglycinamidine cyclo-ligase [Eubacteriales bacterium]|jgi:phosphoribosylformylglycinamidine cyclo-ligase|nr:phosphoribosylformylglycinamidine cyclo-ligase [Eubacteriales bacterium]
MPVTYQEAGVSVEAGYEAVRRMKAYAEATFDENVLQSLGSFGGMYALGEQVLVSGTDGVGTKLKAAFALEIHDTVGIDCVAMCANDVVCHGAKPLFFLDYIATGKLVPDVAAAIVKGVATGCKQAGCALIGGETAEMPGFYPIGEYDLAGFCVGIVDKTNLIDNSRVRAGDAIIALASSGVHSNGFSLVRKLIPMEKVTLDEFLPELGKTLGEELLTPTNLYVKPVLSLIEQVEVHSISHITGGGFYENIPRSIPKGLTARIERARVRVLPIFRLLQSLGELDERHMFNTFNMGVGMTITLTADAADKALALLNASGVTAYAIGEVVSGDAGVTLC